MNCIAVIFVHYQNSRPSGAGTGHHRGQSMVFGNIYRSHMREGAGDLGAAQRPGKD